MMKSVCVNYTVEDMIYILRVINIRIYSYPTYGNYTMI